MRYLSLILPLFMFVLSIVLNKTYQFNPVYGNPLILPISITVIIGFVLSVYSLYKDSKKTLGIIGIVVNLLFLLINIY